MYQKRVKHFISLLFFLFSLKSYSDDPFAKIRLDRLEFIAIYSKQWQQDSTDVQSVREEPMILLIGTEISKFYSFNNHLTFDSILPGHSRVDRLQMIASRRAPHSAIMYRVFKNHRSQTIEFYDRIVTDLLKYTMPLNAFQWNILSDTQQMFGYSVQKATTSFAGRDWVAWFAPEIPISDGPYKFNGLPGLIVLLHDTRNHYTFSLTSFEENRKERFVENFLSFQNSAFIVDRRRLISMRKQFVQDPFSFMPNITPTGGEAQRQEVLDRMRRRNNMLELRY